MRFYFQIVKKGKILNKLIFANESKIFNFNYQTEQMIDMVIFDKPLEKKPEYFKMNHTQTTMLISSQDDCIFYNH